jgi:hypothetical protein
MAKELDLFDIKSYDDDKFEVSTVVEKSVETTSVKKDFCEDITLDNLPKSLDELEVQIDRLKQRWSEFTYLIGQRLKFINDEKLFKEKGYEDFQTYVNIALKMSENNAYYYIAIYEYFTEDQTRQAGSKLKLIIPILNKIKRDKEIPDELRGARIKDMRDELFTKIYNKTYREAEKFIQDVRAKYFSEIEKIEKFQRISVKEGKIIIYEDDKDIQDQLVKIISEFYE